MKLLHKLKAVIIVALTFILNINCELYTSYNDLISLAKTQINVTQHLKEFLDFQEEKVNRAKLYVFFLNWKFEKVAV